MLPLAHLAIAVSNLEDASELYAALGFRIGPLEVVPHEQVRLQLAEKDDLRVELLEAFPPGQGPIAKFIDKRGAGLHHMALWCDDLGLELARLEKAGIKTLPGYPAPGAGSTRVAFLDPKTTGGVLIELSEKVVANS